jgi:hypothetical protein
MSPSARLLPDGRRLHLQHGPIDLIIEAWGAPAAVAAAYERAVARFPTILPELIAQLPMLKSPLPKKSRPREAGEGREGAGPHHASNGGDCSAALPPPYPPPLRGGGISNRSAAWT